MRGIAGRRWKSWTALADRELLGSVPGGCVNFNFGKNWTLFLRELDEGRVRSAADSLKAMLGRETLAGMTFLDAGSGSGLFSLAARRLGARVRSFDLDEACVACGRALKDRFFPTDDGWVLGRGSALDGPFLEGLGSFDVVYSWGVLHHTGALWKALDLVSARVKRGGVLFIAVYNDQGWRSRAWKAVKRTYNAVPAPIKALVLAVCLVRMWGPTSVKDVLRGRPGATWRARRGERGMSPWRDVVDWVGGYPFETALPAAVESFLVSRGFRPLKRVLCGGSGCNEFIMEKT